MKEDKHTRKLPKNFWGLLIAAVFIGNVSMLILLWLGVQAWVAAATPTAAVGFVGIVFAYRERQDRTGSD